MSDWGPDPEWPSDVPDFGEPGVGRHRAPAKPRSRAMSRMLAPLVAVAVVAAAVGVLIVIRGHGSGSGPGPGVIVAPTTTPVVTPTLTPSESTTPTPSIALTHPAPTPSPTKTHHEPPAWKTAMAAVRVYNSTHITGLAHHVAAEIAAKGWTVPDVGNVTGTSSQTTLYYGPNSKDAARHLAKQFPGIQRIQPNSEQQLDYPGLTLVLTADWHD